LLRPLHRVRQRGGSHPARRTAADDNVVHRTRSSC
jgi:hypothetical protein